MLRVAGKGGWSNHCRALLLRVRVAGAARWIDPLELEAGHIRENTRRMSWRELDRVEDGA